MATEDVKNYLRGEKSEKGRVSSDWTWFEHFQSHSDEVEQIQKMLEGNTKSFKLNTVRSMISIGPATGLLDKSIINTCLCNLEHYIGVEPDIKMFNLLTTTMKSLPKLQVTLVNDSVPGWAGPSQPVDLVLASHVLFFIQDKVAAIKQFYKWLTPGGSVLFFHSYRDDLLTQIAKENLIRRGEPYCINDLRRDLYNQGFQEYEETKFKIHMHISAHDDEILRMYFRVWLENVSEEKLLNAIRAFRERCQGNGSRIPLTEGCIKLGKPRDK